VASAFPRAGEQTLRKAQVAGFAVSSAEPEAVHGVTHGVSRGVSVLVLDEWLHYPPNSGRGVRAWSLLQRLARRQRVSLLCYGDPEAEAAVAARAALLLSDLVRPFPAPRASLPLEASQVAPRFRGLHTSR
jgi:hypothetical protein